MPRFEEIESHFSLHVYPALPCTHTLHPLHTTDEFKVLKKRALVETHYTRPWPGGEIPYELSFQDGACELHTDRVSIIMS